MERENYMKYLTNVLMGSITKKSKIISGSYFVVRFLGANLYYYILT